MILYGYTPILSCSCTMMHLIILSYLTIIVVLNLLVIKFFN